MTVLNTIVKHIVSKALQSKYSTTACRFIEKYNKSINSKTIFCMLAFFSFFGTLNIANAQSTYDSSLVTSVNSFLKDSTTEYEKFERQGLRKADCSQIANRYFIGADIVAMISVFQATDFHTNCELKRMAGQIDSCDNDDYMYEGMYLFWHKPYVIVGLMHVLSFETDAGHITNVICRRLIS